MAHKAFAQLSCGEQLVPEIKKNQEHVLRILRRVAHRGPNNQEGVTELTYFLPRTVHSENSSMTP